jgi:hypothetical protein
MHSRIAHFPQNLMHIHFLFKKTFPQIAYLVQAMAHGPDVEQTRFKGRFQLFPGQLVVAGCWLLELKVCKVYKVYKFESSKTGCWLSGVPVRCTWWLGCVASDFKVSVLVGVRLQVAPRLLSSAVASAKTDGS